MPTSCHCGRQWTGLGQAHCTVCHEHFSSVENFDRHGPSYRGCGDPRTLTRVRKDGREVPVLKASEGPNGVTWVGWYAGEHPHARTDAES